MLIQSKGRHKIMSKKLFFKKYTTTNSIFVPFNANSTQAFIDFTE